MFYQRACTVFPPPSFLDLTRPAPRMPRLLSFSLRTQDGAFGCRVENVMIVQPAETEFQFGGKPFLRFEHVTWVPLQPKLIALHMLSAEERRWVDDYHAGVWAHLAPERVASFADMQARRERGKGGRGRGHTRLY